MRTEGGQILRRGSHLFPPNSAQKIGREGSEVAAFHRPGHRRGRLSSAVIAPVIVIVVVSVRAWRGLILMNTAHWKRDTAERSTTNKI